MEIIEENDDRADGGERREEIPHIAKERGLTRNLTDATARGEGGGGWRERGIGVITVEEVAPRAIRGGLGEVETAPDEYKRPLVSRLPVERFGERGLADARFSADQHEPAMPCEHLRQ